MINLLPTPKLCRENKGKIISFSPFISSESEEFSIHIPAFSKIFEKLFKIKLCEGKGGLELIRDSAIPPDSYIIDTSDGFAIRASAKEGLMYGLSTAIQLIKEDNSSLSAPSVYIEDRPDKSYRSLMLDLSREWHTMEQILKFVDLCFLYKINYLHLHFIDDPRYTLPSRLFPKLSTVGESYTAEEIEKLVNYAHARGINLVPEFECPGHAGSMTTQYPEIFANISDGDSGKFYNELGEEMSCDSLLCAGSEKAFKATCDLLTEMSEMFPHSKYIHIGGDEALIQLWNQCPTCRKYMKANGIEDVYELYSEYVARITDHILSIGRTPIVWEGFPKKGAERISKDVVVIAWESHYHLAPELLEEGFTVINASWQPLYIVPSLNHRWTPTDILCWNVYNWQHWWEHSVATKTPITVPETDKVMGSILCSWCITYEQEVARIMENLMAMNERVWNTAQVKTAPEYITAFKTVYPLAARIMQ